MPRKRPRSPKLHRPDPTRPAPIWEPPTDPDDLREALKLRATLGRAMTFLRGEYAPRLKAELSEFPKMTLPCDTCAFRTSTDDWNGFERTVAGVVVALLTNRSFYCHHNLPVDEHGQWHPPLRLDDYGKLVPDLRRMDLCAGYAVLSSLPLLDLTQLDPEWVLTSAAICALDVEGDDDDPKTQERRVARAAAVIDAFKDAVERQRGR
jgi:hypothetical protein